MAEKDSKFKVDDKKKVETKGDRKITSGWNKRTGHYEVKSEIIKKDKKKGS